MPHNKMLLGLLISLLSSSLYADPTIKTCTTQLIQPLANWDIIAYNVADIPTSQAFKGKDIAYSLKAQPQNKINKIVIDAHNGTIKINADGRDQFDVTVTATNQCGSSSMTFNVLISEEK